jgi:O-antigen/teichoic acid export membrane protein
LVAVYVRCERALVLVFLGQHAVGVYYAAVAVTDMWNYAPAVILSSLYPLLVEAKSGDSKLYARKIQMAFDALTVLGYLVAAGGIVLGPWAIRAIFGPGFEDAAGVLVVQACSAPIVFNGSVRAQYFLLENRTVYHTAAAVLGIAVNITAALFLMPAYGPSGAAGAALLGYFVSGYATSFLFSDLKPCRAYQTLAFLVPFRIPSVVTSARWLWTRGGQAG